MKARRYLMTGAGLLAAFAAWTALIRLVDVQAVGPEGTRVGLAGFNTWFHELTGVHMTVYNVTDWLGLVPISICMCFAGVGLFQLIKRRGLLRVDADILLLGVYYILVISAYLIFEMIPINYRPVLIDGYLEASYPSSTALLALSVMPTPVFRIYRRVGVAAVSRLIFVSAAVFAAFMAVGRLISGVHWATDIIGSVLLSVGLFELYLGAVDLIDKRRSNGIQ